MREGNEGARKTGAPGGKTEGLLPPALRLQEFYPGPMDFRVNEGAEGQLRKCRGYGALRLHTGGPARSMTVSQ